MPLITSTPELLALHAVRLKGMADDRAVAGRFGLPPDQVTELLLDFQAYGWITRVEFDGTFGWTLTEAGRVENERQLAVELDATKARYAVFDCYHRFRSRNIKLVTACTDWQLRPMQGDPLAPNDHLDVVWDRKVLETLDYLDAILARLVEELSGVLPRFKGYDDRFDQALTRVDAGNHDWVTGVGIDSCHSVWMELHEDLLATVGVDRSYELRRR